MNRFLRSVLLLTAAGVGSSGSALAQRTLRVPSRNYPTIQSAIDAARNSDTVSVARGSYAEILSVKNKAIRIQGEEGKHSTFIIAPTPWPRGLGLVNFENVGRATHLRGFTLTFDLTKGYFPTHVISFINCVASSPTIEDVKALGVAAYPTVGLVGWPKSSPRVVRSRLTLNPVFGAILMDGSSELSNCMIDSNGIAGLYLLGGKVTLGSCTIAGNVGPPTNAPGVLASRSNLEIANTIIWGNLGGTGKDLQVAGGSLLLSHSDVKGGPTTGSNLDRDPRYMAAQSRNYRITPESPCRGRGDPSSSLAGFLDYDRQARRQGGHVDIGADQYYPVTYYGRATHGMQKEAPHVNVVGTPTPTNRQHLRFEAYDPDRNKVMLFSVSPPWPIAPSPFALEIAGNWALNCYPGVLPLMVHSNDYTLLWNYLSWQNLLAFSTGWIAGTDASGKATLRPLALPRMEAGLYHMQWHSVDDQGLAKVLIGNVGRYAIDLAASQLPRGVSDAIQKLFSPLNYKVPFRSSRGAMVYLSPRNSIVSLWQKGKNNNNPGTGEIIHQDPYVFARRPHWYRLKIIMNDQRSISRSGRASFFYQTIHHHYESLRLSTFEDPPNEIAFRAIPLTGDDRRSRLVFQRLASPKNKLRPIRIEATLPPRFVKTFGGIDPGGAKPYVLVSQPAPRMVVYAYASDAQGGNAISSSPSRIDKDTESIALYQEGKLLNEVSISSIGQRLQLLGRVGQLEPGDYSFGLIERF